MNQRERMNMDDDTKVMPPVTRNETVSYHDMAIHIALLAIEDTFPAGKELPDFEIYVVWFCKTLQNWKALVSTTLPGNKYYEVTHNGDMRETYVDTYEKTDNRKYLDSEL